MVPADDCRDCRHRCTNDDIVLGWFDCLTVVAVIGFAEAANLRIAWNFGLATVVVFRFITTAASASNRHTCEN